MCAWGLENIALRQQQGEEIMLLENKESVLDSLPLDSIIEKKENLK
jgi:hypothetical protein